MDLMSWGAEKTTALLWCQRHQNPDMLHKNAVSLNSAVIAVFALRNVLFAMDSRIAKVCILLIDN